MEVIKDMKVYTERMEQSMFDKVWWLDKIDESIDTVVDFGCADGALFDFLEHIAPGRFKTYVGIDDNEDFICDFFMRAQHGGYTRKTWLRRSLVEAERDKLFNGSRAILVMNSVVHEIMSYHNSYYHDILTKHIRRAGFAAIAIRDMEVSYEGDCDPTWVRSTVAYIARREELKDLFANHMKNYHGYFDNYPDSDASENLKKQNMLKEFLLKYRYKENWERESKETYLWPVRLLVLERLNDYDIGWSNTYFIPWIWRRIETDIGMVTPIETHVQILLEKK